MTHRTENREPTQIELATMHVQERINDAVHQAIALHKPALPDREFRRMLALHFYDKTIAQWCQLLRIPDATNPDDKPTHGGES